MAPAAGFDPATKWLTALSFEQKKHSLLANR